MDIWISLTLLPNNLNSRLLQESLNYYINILEQNNKKITLFLQL